jgi:hypothetical protein
MSLWVDSVTVAGLACITYGTFAQAAASRTDFKSLNATVNRIKEEEKWRRAAEWVEEMESREPLVVDFDWSQATDEEKIRAVAERFARMASQPRPGEKWVNVDRFLERTSKWPYSWWWFYTSVYKSVYKSMVHFWRVYARQIRDEGGPDAVELKRLLRQTKVWAIICFGSTLVLIGAVVSLIYGATAH